MNTQRNNKDATVHVTDKHIKEIDDLHHNIDTNLGQGVKISPSTITTEDLKVAVTTERSYSVNVFRSIPSITGNMIQHSALYLTYTSTGTVDSQGSSNPIIHGDEIIDHVVKRRKEKKIRNDETISLLHSKDHNHDVTRDTADTVLDNSDEAMFTNSEYGSMIIKESNEERDEEHTGYTVDAEVDNKVNSKIALGNYFLTSNKVKITDDVITINKY